MKGKSKKESELSKLKKKMLEKYNSWKQVYCPALKANVYFTRKGWNHLVTTVYRSKREYMERLEILPLSKKLLGQVKEITSKRNKQHTITFKKDMDGRVISVIVLKDKKKYVFLSNFVEQ